MTTATDKMERALVCLRTEAPASIVDDVTKIVHEAFEEQRLALSHTLWVLVDAGHHGDSIIPCRMCDAVNELRKHDIIAQEPKL